jgi:rsbT co-antagonist protein RsbR
MTVAALMTEMNLTDEEIQRRLKFVGFGPSDVKRVLALSGLIVEDAEKYTASFFDYLRSLDEARPLVNDRAMMEAASRLKTEHLKAMSRGEYGRSYVEDRLTLGLIYARADLDPRVFLGAYQHLLRTIGSRVMGESRGRPGEAFENFMSLEKVAFFDLSLIVDVIIFERERVIRRQQEAIRELSTPIMQVRDRLLILPIIGLLDTQRAKQLTADLLDTIRARRAKVVVMDVTGVPIVDTTVANHLVQTVRAARLIGATTVITGLSAQVSEALITLGTDAGVLNTAGDLQGGIEEAERILGHEVTGQAAPDGARMNAAGTPAGSLRPTVRSASRIV